MAEDHVGIPNLYAGRDDDPWRYELWTEAGGGAEGRVWRSTRHQNDGTRIEVAVKVMNPGRFGGDEPLGVVAAKWEDQAAQLRDLRAPGMVGVQEAFVAGPPHPPNQEVPTEPRTLYFVMSWVGGDDLATWASEHPRPADRLAVLETAASGLDALHDAGHVHADIKPSNVRVRAMGPDPANPIYEAVFVDFGLMRTITGERPSRIGGSPGYWAPELFRPDGTYSRQADLYGLTALLAFLLTDEPPPAAGDAQAIVRQRLEAKRVPPAAVDTLVGALDPDPAERAHRSATALLSAVRNGLSSSMQVTVADPDWAAKGAAVVSPPRWRSKGPALVALAIAVALGVVVALLQRGDGAGETGATGAPSTTTAAPMTTSAPTSAPTTTSPPTTTSSTSTSSTTISTTVAPTTTSTAPAATVPTLPSTLYLSDAQPAEQSGNNTNPYGGLVVINGENYTHGLTFENGFDRERWSYDYNLSKAYNTFTSVVGLPENNARSDAPFILAIYLDGTKVFEQSLSLGRPQTVRFGVTGVLRIRFEMTPQNRRYYGAVALGDPKATK